MRLRGRTGSGQGKTHSFCFFRLNAIVYFFQEELKIVADLKGRDKGRPAPQPGGLRLPAAERGGGGGAATAESPPPRLRPRGHFCQRVLCWYPLPFTPRVFQLLSRSFDAGEAESEEWLPLGAASGKAMAGRRVEKGGVAAAAIGGPNSRPFAGRRHVSSSSEPESSAGPVWTTGSELEESEVLWTAEEELPAVGPGAEAVYFSGPETLPPVPGPAAVVVAAPAAEETPSPSELSSGMLMCEWANDNRRAKAARRKAYPLKGTRRQSAAATADFAPPPPLPKSVAAAAAAAAASSRPRSKPRQLILAAQTTGPLEGSSEGSSDAEAGRGEAGKGKGKPKRAPDSAAAVRSHRPPHSSQSQQRCHACALRLSLPATFQCRCGKAFCSRHRAPESHACHAELGPAAAAQPPRPPPKYHHHPPAFPQISD